jgi:hypothetical protein
MRFLAQVDSEPALDLVIANAGMLYAFSCLRCGEIATLAQVE